ncbi:MAG: 3-methyl-2-oxobutanoate hydroxymethyltransferase [Gammaproteobacteria bacterium]|nr:3-methyl-2-oxobutanoate hydroxymethyltransferase [Gammaproteobacteria bacterium]MYD76996.1 3-methyl-2-oxobutanoate hydroxymethyltransferase [Gammaproteobacteria bacterium]MYJ51925.1 3-methyl-2-oxobutanoate hydroxymethyltransferase [Gammaproteobacteria bacterium]
MHTIATLNSMKARGEKIASVTAYDYCSAFAASEVGIELILVGDSLGMVIHGHDSSLPVTIHDMAYHMRCVKRGNNKALLMADLPFMSYYCESKSLENAAVLMREGAQMVKLEGGAWLAESTRLLTERGIPVCAHMGLTPQSVNHLGGYRVQGRDPEKRQAIIDEALVLQDAGACIILIECVPEALGEELTRALDVPVIGIGAGSATDGQILVWHDLLGLYPGKKAKFVKNFLEGTTGGIQGALAEYVRQVKSGEFPDAKHSYA